MQLGLRCEATPIQTQTLSLSFSGVVHPSSLIVSFVTQGVPKHARKHYPHARSHLVGCYRGYAIDVTHTKRWGVTCAGRVAREARHAMTVGGEAVDFLKFFRFAGVCVKIMKVFKKQRLAMEN